MNRTVKTTGNNFFSNLQRLSAFFIINRQLQTRVISSRHGKIPHQALITSLTTRDYVLTDWHLPSWRKINTFRIDSVATTHGGRPGIFSAFIFSHALCSDSFNANGDTCRTFILCLFKFI